ncbi:phage tail tube protein (plasmid) [Halobacillus litoralis]|uniref:phage tail tube protein n=1 Tax=Halobacillus litoralis TaxID=45668 RepID=UPI001CFD0188|nr:phage tail tube protein [Halobacillus litoralis]WLR49593.1 phage tail tube protein [Halobacillus litoralis]
MAFHGHDSYVTYGKETNFGTKASSPDIWIGIIQSFSPEESNNLQTQYGLGSRNFIQSRLGASNFGFSVEYLVQDLHIMEYVLGQVTDNGDGTFDFAESNDLPSATFQAGVINPSGDDFIREYVGSKLDSFTLSASTEEALTAEAEWIAKELDDSVVSGSQPVADTSSYFMFYEGNITIDGVQQGLVEEFELEVSNGLERKYAINGERVPARILEGNREYTLSLSFTFEDEAQWDLWKAGTEFDTELTFTAPDGRTFTVTATGGKYDSNEIELGNEDNLVQELEARVKSVSATYDDATGGA